jgi:hypothetical protein
MVRLKRVFALTLVAALVLVPAVGRARQRVDLPNAKPRLSAPYRSVDVRPAPILVAPDTSAVRADAGTDEARQFVELTDQALPPGPDVVDRGTLRGPPLS